MLLIVPSGATRMESWGEETKLMLLLSALPHSSPPLGVLAQGEAQGNILARVMVHLGCSSTIIPLGAIGGKRGARAAPRAACLGLLDPPTCRAAAHAQLGRPIYWLAMRSASWPTSLARSCSSPQPVGCTPQRGKVRSGTRPYIVLGLSAQLGKPIHWQLVARTVGLHRKQLAGRRQPPGSSGPRPTENCRRT